MSLEEADGALFAALRQQVRTLFPFPNALPRVILHSSQKSEEKKIEQKRRSHGKEISRSWKREIEREREREREAGWKVLELSSL